MKKHRSAEELAKSILEAASKPPGITSPPVPPTPPLVRVETTAIAEPPPQETKTGPEAAEPPAKRAEQARVPKKSGKRDLEKKAANDDTVAMSLRPPRGMYERYVMAAAHRTLAVGRVVSVQDVILEVMERGL